MAIELSEAASALLLAVAQDPSGLILRLTAVGGSAVLKTNDRIFGDGTPCLVHRLRNLRSKAPESRWPEIALRARGCYEAASAALAAVAAGRLRPDVRAASCRPWCSASVMTSTPASPTCASRSGIAASFAPRICSSGCSSKSVGGQRSSRARSASAQWRGIAVGEFEQRQLRAIREELGRAHAERMAPAVAAKATAAVRRSEWIGDRRRTRFRIWLQIDDLGVGRYLAIPEIAPVGSTPSGVRRPQAYS